MKRICIIYYSLHGHVAQLAEIMKSSIEDVGGIVDIYRLPETLSEDVLEKVFAAPKKAHPLLETYTVLEQYDGFLWGIPSRFGDFPPQWLHFWEVCGNPLFYRGSLHGKYVGIFVSTSSLGGGQESTIINALSIACHLGLLYVPLGYKHAQSILQATDEPRAGSAWGSGVLVGTDNARSATYWEKELASIQAQTFYNVIPDPK